MDWRSIDLNLLVVFNAILENRGVTRAGAALGMSQPAMSAALGRLRELFNDPLFVRSGTEMKPTSRALELEGPLRRVLESVRTDLLQRAGFDPLATRRTFTVLTPDIGEMVFAPLLRDCFARGAPGARLRCLSRPPVAAAEALESGEADVALGYFPDLQKAGFFQQKLLDVPMVCLVRREHRTIGDHISAEQYLAASHVLVRPAGRGKELVPIERLQLRVAVEVAHFTSVLPLLEASELIAAVPADVARLCSRYADLRIVPLPEEFAFSIPVHQFWSERFHKDPAHVWLRELLVQVRRSETGTGP
jgi:DNA-binding transcriptional LysR family regulator